MHSINKRKLSISMAFLVIFPLMSCKFIGNKSTNKSTQLSDEKLGLDVSDLSILYPPAAVSGGKSSKYGDLLFPKEAMKTPNQPETFPVSMNERLQNLSHLGYWPQILPENGKALISPKVFQEITEFAALGSAKFPKPVGIDFKLPSWENNPYYDMADPKRWRVVSVRFDPCPHSNIHLTKPETYPKRCKAELRIIAQPVVGFSVMEMITGNSLPRVGLIKGGQAGASMIQSQQDNFHRLNSNSVNAGGWYFADYAIHLFFSLGDINSSDAKMVASELAVLKSGSRSLCDTTGYPLSVHPCLLAQLSDKNLTAETSFAAKLKTIIEKSSTKLDKIAFFGSRANENPWLFFLGDVKENSFTPILVPGLQEFQGNSALQASNNPLPNRLAMQITRGVAIGNVVGSEGDVREISDAEKSIGRILPLPHPKRDSLYMMLRGGETGADGQTQREYTLALEAEKTRGNPALGLSNIELTGKSRSDARQVSARIENPKFNSEFTVECVSCHAANYESGRTFLKYANAAVENIYAIKSKTFSLNPESFDSYFGPEQSDFHKKLDFTIVSSLNIPQMSEFFKNDLKFSYVPSQGITSFTLPIHTVVGSQNGHSLTYVMNQFSIYKHWPLVSQRVLNETVDAADFTNKFILQKSNPVQNQAPWYLLKLCNATHGTSETWYEQIKWARNCQEHYSK